MSGRWWWDGKERTYLRRILKEQPKNGSSYWKWGIIVRGVRGVSSGPNDEEISGTLKRMKGTGFEGGEKRCASYLDMINNF